MKFTKLSRIYTARSHAIMSFNKLIQVSEQAPRADKSAMAAINRALRSVAGLFLESSLSRQGQSGGATQVQVGHAPPRGAINRAATHP
jgi:hypothetical protein